MTPTLEWAAGLFEGEGTAYINVDKRKDKTYRRPFIQITMTDLDALESFAAVMGGKVNGPYGPYAYHKPHYKPKYVWQLTGGPALAACRTLRPFLHSRRVEQVDVLLREFG